MLEDFLFYNIHDTVSTGSMEVSFIDENRDGLKLEVLSGANLDIMRQYGVEHNKGLGFTTTKYRVFSNGDPVFLAIKN